MTRGPSGVGPLTRAATGGALWMGGSLGVQIGIGLVAQVILAAILTAHDFGLFALVVAVSYVLSSVGNFGVKTLMASRPLAELDDIRKPLFRAGLAAAALSGLTLAAISGVVANLLDEPELQALMLVTTATFLLKPYVAVASAVLQARLRFASVAWALLLGSVSGYAVAIAMAVAGAGAMSLVVNIQVNMVVTALVLWGSLRGTPPSTATNPLTTKQAMALARWPMAGEVAMDATGRIDFLMLGLFVPTEIVGVYYFAFNLVLRLNELLTGVARNVLFPALAQIPERPDRQASGVFRAGSALATAGGAVAAMLIATMAPIEDILWGGRWAVAVPAVMLLASAAPGQAVQSAIEQLLKARGRFRWWTGVITIRAVGSALVALVVGMVLGDDATATAVAGAVIAFLVLNGLVEQMWVGRGMGMPVSRYLLVSLPPWSALVAVGWLVAGVTSGWDANPWLVATVSATAVGAVSVGIGLVVWRLPVMRD